MITNCHNSVVVSVIVTIHNGEQWIPSCFESLTQQDILGRENVEVSVYNDASTDKTEDMLLEWKDKLSAANISMVLSSNSELNCKGVGYGRNQAVKESSGEFLCFQDIDDVMLPEKMSKQLEAARTHPDCIIGSKFQRIPEDATHRFTLWANSLSQEQLSMQVYTSHGPTVIMPTWFCSRSVFNRVGQFDESGKGTPEDLIFFYQHLDHQGGVYRVDQVLLLYRHHSEATTLSVSEDTIWDIRIRQLESSVLRHWPSFCVWNAGKQGRKFYRSLSPQHRGKVTSFCDVDVKKIGKWYEPYEKLTGEASRKIPIVHFTKAIPPLVICVKMDLTGGAFEKNLISLNLEEGKDYVMFS